MPRRERVPVEARRFLHPTGTSLAKALGIHRNTWSAWRREGCPAEKPYDEQAVRVWAAAHRYRCPARPCPELLQILVDAGVAGYQAMLEPTVPLDAQPERSGRSVDRASLLPGESAYDEAVRAGVITYAQAAEREVLRKLEVDNRIKERRDQVEAGELVERAALVELARAIRARIDQAAGQFGQRVADRAALGERGASVVVAQAAGAVLDEMLDEVVEGAVRG